MRKAVVGMTLTFAMGLCSTAAAHITLTNPPARSMDNDLQTAPCGDIAPTGMPTEFTAGEEILVTWDIMANHNGTMQVRFSYMDDMGFDNNVLIMDHPDTFDTPAEVMVTLPDMPCDPCTLQLWQLNSVPADGDYYSCADVRLIEAAGSSSGGAGSSSSGGAGDSSSGGNGDSDSGGSTSNASADSANPTASTTNGSMGGTGQTTGDTAGTDDDSSGCACRSTTPVSGGTWALMLLTLAAIRRRRS